MIYGEFGRNSIKPVCLDLTYILQASFSLQNICQIKINTHRLGNVGHQ